MLRKYKITVAIDNKTIEINDQVETNYEEGSAKQVAQLLYRAMLAAGFTPTVTCDALGKVAEGGGYVGEYDENRSLFELSDGGALL